MAFRLYGASTADYAIRTATARNGAGVDVDDLTQLAPGTSIAVATAPNGASRITSGLADLSGTPITAVTADADGEIRFQGDTTYPLDLWLTTIDGLGNLGSKWYVVHAAEIGLAVSAAVVAAETAADEAQAAAAQAAAGVVADNAVTDVKVAAGAAIAPSKIAGTALTVATGVSKTAFDAVIEDGRLLPDALPENVADLIGGFGQWTLVFDTLPALVSGQVELTPGGIVSTGVPIKGGALWADVRPASENLRVSVRAADGTTELGALTLTPGAQPEAVSSFSFTVPRGQRIRLFLTSGPSATGVSVTLMTEEPVEPRDIDPPVTDNAFLVALPKLSSAHPTAGGAVSVGKPACIVGDLVFVLWSTKMSSSGSFTAPAGWTLLGSATATASDFYVYYRVVDSTFAALAVDSPLTWTTTSAEPQVAGAAFAVRDGGTPVLGAFATGTGTGPAASATPATGALVFFAQADTDSSVQSASPPSGFTEIADVTAQYGYRHLSVSVRSTLASGALISAAGVLSASASWSAVVLSVPAA